MDRIFLSAGVLTQLGGLFILLLRYGLWYFNWSERRRMVGSRGHFITLRLSAAKYAPVLRDDYRIPLQLDSTRLAHATVRLVSNGLLRHSKLFCLPFYSRQ
jgi:hypothetical protein